MPVPPREPSGVPRRLRRAPALLALAALGLGAALGAAACSSSTEAKPSKSPSPPPIDTGGPVLPAAVWPAADRKHLDIVFSYLQAAQPAGPMAYLLGGSAARECTVSDESWRREIRAAGGPDVLAFNLGSTNQSFDADMGMVRAMPKAPSVVLIGINLGRYTSAPEKPYKPPAAGPDLTLAQVDEYEQHKFDEHHILRDERKVSIIEDYWLGGRQAEYDEHFAYNAGRLRALVALCKRRGLHPVLVNLPLNFATIGHRLDAQRERYRQDCLAVSRELGVPYVDFVADVPFVTRDFADNWHLVPSGRAKWQRELSRVTAAEFARYGIGPSPAAEP